jgi:hypothetical protein
MTIAPENVMGAKYSGVVSSDVVDNIRFGVSSPQQRQTSATVLISQSWNSFTGLVCNARGRQTNQ